jgi:hypothetical protein
MKLTNNDITELTDTEEYDEDGTYMEDTMFFMCEMLLEKTNISPMNDIPLYDYFACEESNFHQTIFYYKIPQTYKNYKTVAKKVFSSKYDYKSCEDGIAYYKPYNPTSDFKELCDICGYRTKTNNATDYEQIREKLFKNEQIKQFKKITANGNTVATLIESTSHFVLFVHTDS